MNGESFICIYHDFPQDFRNINKRLHFITVCTKMLTNNAITKILRLFYSRKTFHVREIARQTNLNQNSVIQALKHLKKEEIVTYRLDANLKKYCLNQNKKSFTYLTLMDVERLEALPLLRKNAINRYVQLVPKATFILVFGSTAKNNYKNDSDIDLLVITDENTKIAQKEINAVQSMNVNTIHMSYEAFIKELKLKEEPVIQSAIESGFPIINHIKYYETIMPPPF